MLELVNKTRNAITSYINQPGKKTTLAILVGGVLILSFFTMVQDRYLISIPKEGGSMSEALVGTPRFTNPVLARSQIDKDITELVYGSLLTVDATGSIKNELAENITISEDKKEYIIVLRPDIFFHDGEAIEASDVVFTINRIQDTIIQSPERSKWFGVEVQELSSTELLFTLDKAYPLFLQNLELGIIPEHIWGEVAVEEFPFSAKNINPVGSGAFEITNVVRNTDDVITGYTLTAFRDSIYNPYLDTIELHITKTPEEQVDLYTRNIVDAAAGIDPSLINSITLEKTSIRNHVLPRVFSLFYNQEKDTALSYKEVRTVLDSLIDKEAITQEVFNGYARTINSPLPPTSPYTTLYESSDSTQEEKIESARTLLTKNSWKFSEDKKVWTKKINDKDVDLAFTLYAPNSDDLILTANRIRNDLAQLQIPVTVLYQDIESLTQDVIRPRAYELLLFGYVTDIPADLYPFWHSSGRIDPGLNIAEYVNITSDKELETIRTETSEEKIASSYERLQKEISADVPASFLFTPEFIYLQRDHILQDQPSGSLAFPEDRFRNAESWYVETENILPNFLK